MAQPGEVRLKRKRTEDAPDLLILEAPSDNPASKKLRYVRHTSQKSDKDVKAAAEEQQYEKQSLSSTSPSNEQEPQFRREFQLKRKRKGDDDIVATFVEKKARGEHTAAEPTKDESPSQTGSASSPLKKPSKRAAVKVAEGTVPELETDEHRKRMEELAVTMQQDVLNEIEREQAVSSRAAQGAQPRRVTPPKMSAARSLELHRRRRATNGSINANRDHDMEDESEYVYDTYILAPSSDLAAAQIEVQSGLESVGYLVITEEDESVWETYLEDEPSDKDWNTDEDDENAEDYYAADYPEDELQSDDGFDRGAYGYRNHAVSDDEQWDDDAGTYSDDEFERMNNPFAAKTTVKRFASYVDHDDDSD